MDHPPSHAILPVFSVFDPASYNIFDLTSLHARQNIKPFLCEPAILASPQALYRLGTSDQAQGLRPSFSSSECSHATLADDLRGVLHGTARALDIIDM